LFGGQNCRIQLVMFRISHPIRGRKPVDPHEFLVGHWSFTDHDPIGSNVFKCFERVETTNMYLSRL
jgi:hypothetical protein